MPISKITKSAVLRQSKKPNSPAEGLLWYDTDTNILKQYKNGSFATVSSNVDGVTINQNQSGEIQVNRPLSGNSVVEKVHLGGFSLDTKTQGTINSSKDQVYLRSDKGKTKVVNAKRDSIGVQGDKIEIDYNAGMAGTGNFASDAGRVEIRVNGNVEFGDSGSGEHGSGNSGTIVLDPYNDQATLNSIFLEAEGGTAPVGGTYDEADDSNVSIDEIRVYSSKEKKVIGIP